MSKTLPVHQSNIERLIRPLGENCSYRGLAHSWVDNDLTQGAKSHFQKHLNNCTQCQKEVNRVKMLNKKIQESLPRDKLSDQEREYFLNQVFEGLEPLIKALEKDRRQNLITEATMTGGKITKIFLGLLFSPSMLVFYTLMVALAFLFER